MKEVHLTPILTDKLFAVIRCGLDLASEAPALSEEECAALLSIGMKQSLQPILYRGLKQSGAPEEVVRDFDRARMQRTYLVIQHSEGLKSIVSVLDECGIPYVPLKGAFLRDLYPVPELRTSNDIDVLVHEEDLEAAVGALEAKTDFRTLRRDYHDISMVNQRVHLELHFTLMHNAENIDGLLARAWDFASPTGEGSCWAFTPEFLVFYVTAHMSKHFTNGGLGIRPFLDLWLLRHKIPFDEDAVRRMCEECRILTFYETCCQLSEVWLGGAAHTETSAFLETFCLSGGVYGSDHFVNASRQRKLRGWRYIASRVFPPLSEIKANYQDDSGKEHSAAYYYRKRIASWLSRGRREELKSKFSDILSGDPDYLDSVDELFGRLGF